MSLVLHVGASRADWWKETMQSLLPDIPVYLWNDDYDIESVRYAVVWKPPAGGLKRFPNLECIVSIGAGIDHIMVDPELPMHVPIIRTTGDQLTVRMREYVLLHVLRLHRRLPDIEAGQAVREWRQIVEPPAPERKVGIMGLGKLGADCAVALAGVGFDVAGWARSRKQIDGVTCFAGEAGFKDFLERTEILVNLLPLTPETEGILDRKLFAALPRGARIINAARGQHLVEEDLLDALESGQIGGATLDVFHKEPLPPEHPFWDHPRILVTPHVASLIDPLAGGRLIAANIMAFRAGAAVPDLVDARRGY